MINFGELLSRLDFCGIDNLEYMYDIVISHSILNRILDMFHIVLISHVCYTGLVTDFTNLESVGRISWSLSVSNLTISSHMCT